MKFGAGLWICCIRKRLRASDVEGAPVHVLTVCTGNICRSPAAHLLLQSAFGPDSGITVSSAGVMAMVGEPVSPPMAALLREVGVDPAGFAARQLTEADVRQADLILGMTREHRREAVALWPAAVRRSYTLKEFARLGPRVPSGDLAAIVGNGAARLAALAELAGRRRAPVPAADDDTDDPFRRGRAVYSAVFAEISDAVATIAKSLRPMRALDE